jgi:hypothetical protein
MRVAIIDFTIAQASQVKHRRHACPATVAMATLSTVFPSLVPSLPLDSRSYLDYLYFSSASRQGRHLSDAP